MGMIKHGQIKKTSLFSGSVLLIFALAQVAFAAGTASDTTISNSATVDYQVNSIAQTQQTSNTATFKVDNKVNLTVVTDEGAVVSVTPGATDQVLTFTVTNTGNTVQDFTVSAVARSGGAGPFGNTDSFNATTVDVFVETAGGAGYQAASDTNTFIDELAADANIKVYIVSDIQTGLADDSYAVYDLLVQARTGGSAGGSVGAALTEDSDGDDPNTVEIVFGDGAGSDTVNDAAEDAEHSDDATYKVAAATLTVTKSSAVISDPINGTTNPLAIPGAVMEYTITISNAAGTATATNITVADSLNTEIVAGTIAFNTQYNATAGQGIVVGHPDFSSGANTEYTNASDSNEHGIVEADWNITATNTVTVTDIRLDAGESATVKFRVTIQ
ncbi:MAG: hypothetical protein ACE5GK_02185 [Nitrospiria bacterium]